MEEDWTSGLPKLLPSWQSCTPEFLSRQKERFQKDRLPDYGGTGVDITTDESCFKFEGSKYGVDQVNFGSKVCALPCFMNGKETHLQDPCLEDIVKQNLNFQKFSSKLVNCRRMLNSKRCTAFRKDVVSSRKLIKNMCLSGKFEKTSVLKSVSDIAKMFPKTHGIVTINTEYSGGCLTAMNKGCESPILLHSIGPKLNKLAASPLIETSNLHQAFKLDQSKRITVKLKGGCIQQVKSAYDGFCYIKQEKQCHFLNSSFEVHPITNSKSRIIKYISPSPYIPTEFISIHEDGNMVLNDMEESEELWETNRLFFSDANVFSVNEKPVACDFGSHPRSILYMDSKGVYAHDLRLKNCPTSLFSSYPSSHYINQTLWSMKRLSVNPFQHLVFSNLHLFLFDERYANKPVLIWNHQLNKSPLYCDIATYDTTSDSTDAVILLATQESRELVSFAVRTGQSRPQTISLAPPLALSSTTDWADSLRFHGHSVESQVINRVCNPLTGVCAVPHYNRPGFTAFQVTSVGDVFYQDFVRGTNPESERTYKVDMGCILAPPEKILPEVSDLMNKFDKEVKDSSCDLNRINIDLKDILRAPLEISDWCAMCQSLIPDCEEKLVSNLICPSCGLEMLESKKLHSKYNETDLIIGPVNESLEAPCLDNMAELSLFTDTYSKRIFSVWNPTQEESEQNASELRESNMDQMDTAMPTSANASYAATQYGDLATSSQLSDSTYIAQQSSQSFFEDITFSESMIKQEPMEDFVPPSQDLRPKIGETLRSAKKKKSLPQLNSSSAGF